MTTVSIALVLSGFALGFALAALVMGERRHARWRRRLRGLERRLESVRREHLTLLRPLYDHAAVDFAEHDRPLGFRSEFGEDMLLAALFAGQRQGFFIEAGASDGRTFAVTHALESLGWTGLLVEALPEAARRAAAARPGSRVVHAALGASAGETTMRVYEGGGWDLASYRRDVHAALPRQAVQPSRDVVVPMQTLGALLEPHRGVIDVLVLDVEGGELDALRGLDLERRRPRVIVLEDHDTRGAGPATRHAVERGYNLVAAHAYNAVLIDASEGELLGRAAALLAFDQHRPLAE